MDDRIAPVVVIAHAPSTLEMTAFEGLVTTEMSEPSDFMQFHGRNKAHFDFQFITTSTTTQVSTAPLAGTIVKTKKWDGMPVFSESTTIRSMDPPIGIHIILHGLSKEVIIDIYFGEHEYDTVIPFESLLALDGQKLSKLKGTVTLTLNSTQLRRERQLISNLPVNIIHHRHFNPGHSGFMSAWLSALEDLIQVKWITTETNPDYVSYLVFFLRKPSEKHPNKDKFPDIDPTSIPSQFHAGNSITSYHPYILKIAIDTPDSLGPQAMSAKHRLHFDFHVITYPVAKEDNKNDDFKGAKWNSSELYSENIYTCHSATPVGLQITLKGAKHDGATAFLFGEYQLGKWVTLHGPISDDRGEVLLNFNARICVTLYSSIIEQEKATLRHLAFDTLHRKNFEHNCLGLMSGWAASLHDIIEIESITHGLFGQFSNFVVFYKRKRLGPKTDKRKSVQFPQSQQTRDTTAAFSEAKPPTPTPSNEIQTNVSTTSNSNSSSNSSTPTNEKRKSVTYEEKRKSGGSISSPISSPQPQPAQTTGKLIDLDD